MIQHSFSANILPVLDLNGVYSVNNTLSPTAVPARVRCVISFVDYYCLL